MSRNYFFPVYDTEVNGMRVSIEVGYSDSQDNVMWGVALYDREMNMSAWFWGGFDWRECIEPYFEMVKLAKWSTGGGGNVPS